MIAYIKGSLEAIGEDHIVIDNSNLGYEIRVPLSLLNELPKLGEDLKVFTYLYVREDAMQLYGFISEADLAVFKLLLTVSGIGPKGALGILSCLTSDALAYAVMTDDDVAISKAPGIGKKTAQRVIIDLKDKLKVADLQTIGKSNATLNSPVSEEKGMMNEAVAALIALGYTNSEALKVTKNIKTFDSVEDILKQALKQLAII
ncbi:MAG: Holliday junction branch migration protein RuvA [Vallitaleaceae bacterium]|nr:Holliday junction branch migration protein RuvA [Vallitaleaceae bacterium]